jgi:hypothetical protein
LCGPSAPTNRMNGPSGTRVGTVTSWPRRTGPGKRRGPPPRGLPSPHQPPRDAVLPLGPLPLIARVLCRPKVQAPGNAAPMARIGESPRSRDL